MSKTLEIAEDASASLPTANLPLAKRRYAGKKPGICFVMLYKSLIPLPTGPAELGLSAPSFISFMEIP